MSERSVNPILNVSRIEEHGKRNVGILSNEFATAMLQDLCLRKPYSRRISVLYLPELKLTAMFMPNIITSLKIMWTLLF
jgi:hypothetical protein